MTKRLQFQCIQSAIAWMLDQVDDPCIDNIRHASKDDPAEMAVYLRAKADGCCGSYDAEVIVAGKETLIGCNYGH